MSPNFDLGFVKPKLGHVVAADLKLQLEDCLAPFVKRLSGMAPQSHDRPGARVAGTTLKYLAFDAEDRLISVVICSSPEEPDVMARAVTRAEEALAALGPLGDVVLMPWRRGAISGISYAAYPYCQPLSRSRYEWIVHRHMIRPRFLTWLRKATKATVYLPAPHEQRDGFRAALENLASQTLLPGELRKSATLALDRFEQGVWVPRHCLMHGDIWKNNILAAPGTRGYLRFVLIDWAGSLLRGYGILDLINAAPSFHLKGTRLRSEIEAHCQILGCDFADARSHLLAALGHIESHRGHFPLNRFAEIAMNSFQFLKTVGG